MSSRRNFGLITLSIIAISVTYYHVSAKKTRVAPGTQKKRPVEEVSVRGGLREVLDNDDPRKPKEPVVDVIAVPGLDSKYPATWMKDDVMWLKDFLPDDFPQARILAFVYPSEAFNNPDSIDLRALGGSLLRSIVKDRENMYSKRKRPLIFIGHSFGGLAIKKALALSQVPNSFVEGTHGYIADATHGILFLGTPHLGSQFTFGGSLRAQLLGIFGWTHKGLLRTLQLLSSELQYVNQDFLAIPVIRKLPQHCLVCFYETKGLLFGVRVQQLLQLIVLTESQPLVEERSACLSIATRVSLNANHEDMNKFSDREGPYDDVQYYLQRIHESIVEPETSTENKNAYIFPVKMDTPGFNLLDCYPSESWSEQKGGMRLSMPGSGTSGTLVFQKQSGTEKFAVTLGVHNYAPWADIATHFGDETPRSIRDSFYGGKRDVWSACNGLRQLSKTLAAERSVVLTFFEEANKKRYPTDVIVK